MSYQFAFAASVLRVRLAGFQQQFIVAPCVLALAILCPVRGLAQQVSYSDFNAPASSPGQTSTSCTANSSPSGALFCFNSVGSGLSFAQDNSYTTSIDPNASNGSAYALVLTQSTGSQASSAWYSIPQNVANGFTAWYAFKITPGSSPYGDGLAFVIQNALGGGVVSNSSVNCSEVGSGLTALGGGGGCIGYGAIDNSIALEADTFADSFDPWDFGFGAYDDNHIAMQDCGAGLANSPAHYTSNSVSPLVPTSCLVDLSGTYAIASNPSSSAGTGGVNIADGSPHQVVVVYNGPNDSPANYIYVYIDPAFNPGTHTPVAGSTPIFSGPFNIAQAINLNNGTAYVGFTAATGGSSQQNELMGFSFTPHGYASANVCPAGQNTPAPCSSSLPVTFNFAATTTISSAVAVTQGTQGLDFQLASGGTCTGTISAGNSCTVNVTFTPLAPGLRLGAVNLLDSLGNTLATKLIYGVGYGPVTAFGPGTATTVNTGGNSLAVPNGVAVDAAGDIFIADGGNGSVGGGAQVLKVAPGGGVSSVGSNLAYPQGLTVDGAGDVYIADNNINLGELLEVPAGCTNNTCQKVLINAQTSVSGATNGTVKAELGVAVDGVGNVFFSDFVDGEVVEVPANGGTPSVVYNPPGSSPVGLAVDATGDLFVTDHGLKEVVKIPPGCTSSSCQTTVGTGWAYPEAVAVDAAGDVFVADEAPKIVEVPAGCKSSACQVTVSTVLAYGLAVDAKGDVFLPDRGPSDNTYHQVVEINKSQPPSLTFAATNVGSTSTDSPQSFTIQNVGNQALGAVSPGLAVNPPNFVEVAGLGAPADCSSTFSLAPGADCNVSISFIPQTGGGLLNSSAVFTDNALNANPAVQTIALSGIGVAPSYALTVTEVGSGTGTVTDDQSQISCNLANGTDTGLCAGNYPSGTMVTLMANATGASTYLGWGGACTSAGTSLTCSVTMNSAASAIAMFGLENFGTINVCPSGLTTPAPCSNTLALTYDATTNVTIGAVQVVTQGATGLDFTLGTGSTCTGAISAGSSCTVNVVFAPLAPGLRMGAVELFDNSGNLLTTMPVYGIGQGPAIAFGPGTQTIVASGLSGASGAAVDAAGDVFISDNAGAMKITSSGVQTPVPTSGISYAYDVAVDGAGNVYLADTGNDRVVEVSPAGVQTMVPAIGLSAPTGVAVDGSGDVFITDLNNNRVVKVTPSGIQTTVPTSGVNRPFYPAVDGAGNLFFLDSGNEQVLKVTPGGTQSRVPIIGLVSGNGVAVDAAGDVFVSDQINNVVLEVSPSGVQTTLPTTGLYIPAGLAVDAAGDVFIADNGQSQAYKINRSQVPSLSFALTNLGSTSVDSPQVVLVQNVGNQPLTGSLVLSLGIPANFTQNLNHDCPAAFPLAPGASCSESFSFTPQATGYLAGTAAFSDNTLNLAQGVSLQTINLSGNGGLNGLPVGVAVPNVVGLTQAAAATALTGVGLIVGTVSTGTSSIVPSGGVIAENPGAGAQVNSGSAINLLLSTGLPLPPEPNPLTFENNYFVTGDYASAGVTLRGTGMGGMATGNIFIPNTGSQSVPDGADIIDAFLYWETLENTAAPSATSGMFDKFSITGQQIGNDLPNYTDGSLTGTLRAYRADVNAYFAPGANGVRYASGTHAVSLPDSGGTGFPLTEGASLVVIYRVLSPNFPLKSVVIYDGLAQPTGSTSQTVQGFYDSASAGENTNLFAAGGSWNNSSGSVTIGTHATQFTSPLNTGSAYNAVIFSTPVSNTDNDGILDAWKTGPPAGDFHAGQPGYYDVKTGAWVGLPGAKQGQKDLFVQLDYMCGAVLSPGVCDSSKENLFPSPDPQGNDPLAMVQQAYSSAGIALHLQIGNAVPEEICMDNTSTSPAQLCEFPGQPGVIGWKNSLEFSKLWPRDIASCAAGGDCSARFPYGQKDSYHYVLFGHSLAIPAWNTRYGTLTSIQVVSGVTTIVTADRGSGSNSCPTRITISGVLGDPSLNGVYAGATCPNTTTITVSTPAVPNWTYPNSALPEPVISLTSGTITSISGYSDLGGADSAVTLGLWLTAPSQDMSKRANVVAGTLYHEIGHTLSLTHGGLYYDTPGSYVPTFEANCKPNYQSVMNYLFQLDLVGPNKAVAYSNQTLNTLNESSAGSLTQLTGPLNSAATFPTSAWYVPYVSGDLATPASMHCDGTPITSGAAYRVDASIAPITPAWTNGQDINFDGQPNETMRGYNDLAGLDLRQVGATGGELASLANVLSFGTSAAPLNIGAGGTVALGSGGTVALGSGGTATLPNGGNVTLSGAGTITMNAGGIVALGSGGTVTVPSNTTITPGSNGTVNLVSGGIVALGSGGIVALGSGGTATLTGGGTVTLSGAGTISIVGGSTVTIPSSGGTYTLGSTGTITLGGSGGIVALGSGGIVALGSGGTVTPGVGGTVGLTSGGIVALGSGGIVALGSGGIVALGSGGNFTLSSGGIVALGSGGIVALGSGGIVALGSGGTVTMGGAGASALGSGGIVALGSGGSAAVGAGGIVALGSGGIVALGSGGNYSLSSGGTITVGASGGNVGLSGGGTVTLSGAGTVTPNVGNPVSFGPSGGSYTFNSSGGIVALGSGGIVALGSGGIVALGSGGIVALGSGGTVTLGDGGAVTLGGSGGIVALGSGGTLALGAGGAPALGSGGIVALGSGGIVALGSGGIVALGSGGADTQGSGGATTNELTYETANSFVRPPASPTETPTPVGVPAADRVDWTAPTFGVVETYTIYRSSNGATPIEVGSVSGQNGVAPATTFTDTNPDLTSQTVVYTISTTLLPVPIDPTERQSAPSPPAMLTNDQTINWVTLPSSVNISALQTTVSATAMTGGSPNGLQVNFSASGPCAIASQSIASGNSSANVTLSGTGKCTITASQAGATDYNAATAVTGTFTILPQGSGLQSQTITFAPLAAVQYGSTFMLSASSNAPQQTVTFSASGPCTMTGTTSGTTTGVGVCKITASTTGNSSYSAASVVQPLTVYPAVLKVTANSTTIQYGQSIPAFTYMITGFVNSDPTTVVSGIPALSTTATAASNAGSYPITVTTGTVAATNYSFLYVSGTLTIQPASQAIVFTMNPPASAAYNSGFSVAATGGASGNPVVFTNAGACSITGSTAGAATYKITSGSGQCSVIANQASSVDYSAATQVTLLVNASLAMPTVTFTGAPASAPYNSHFTVASTTNAGNTALITSSGACTNVGNAVTMSSGTGTCSLSASWASNSNYSSATLAQSTIATPLEQLITFTTKAPASAAFNSSFTVVATGGASGSPLVFTSAGACSNVGATYTMTNSTGTCSVIANQAGNSNYSAAPQVTETVNANGPLLSVSPSSINFGTVTQGSITTKTITVANIGTAPVTINQPILSIVKGGNSNEFVAVNLCPTPLAAGKSCSITIAFVAGPYYTPQTATLEIMDNAPGSPQAVVLSATVLIPQTITFITNPPASATYKSSFTVAATGGASGNAVTFTSSGSCSNSGATYTMTSGTGTCSVIANQAGNSTYAAAAQVTKTVTATYPSASVSPTSLSFGTVSANKSSSPKTVTLSNTGTMPLIIISIGITGTNPGNFVETNTCPSSSSSLAAGKTCTISVTFNSSGKTATANLTITDNTQAGTQTVSLSGN